MLYMKTKLIFGIIILSVFLVGLSIGSVLQSNFDNNPEIISSELSSDTKQRLKDYGITEVIWDKKINQSVVGDATRVRGTLYIYQGKELYRKTEKIISWDFVNDKEGYNDRNDLSLTDDEFLSYRMRRVVDNYLREVILTKLDYENRQDVLVNVGEKEIKL